MEPWTNARFRSTPMLELRRLEELPPEQQNAFRELQDDDDFYGLLVPRADSAMSIKSVGTQTAELFRRLADPSRLDDSLADEAYRSDVIDLVLDGILEIEHGGAFVHGASAFPLFYPTLPAPGDGGRIAALSREAVRHAEDLATRDVPSLTSALYFYNRIPRTRAWTAQFPDRAAVLHHLGADSGPLHALLDRYWMLTPEENAHGWIAWNTRHPRPYGRDAVTFKLYVSPRPEQIREAFHALARVLADIPGAQMKIGPDAAGLLRPDKLVAYFASREELDVAANALRAELHGCPAHGVPFSAGIDDEGLLSWGVDPPDSERVLSWLDRESWRLWIAKTLAAALAIAKTASASPVAPWRFAIERVRRHGVEVDTWTPASTLWRPIA